VSSGSATIHIDGACSGNPGPAGIGAVLADEGGRTIAELSRPLGHATNNIAEYLALVYALIEAQRRGLRELAVKTDSELLVKQLSGEYRVRDATLHLFHSLAGELMRGFTRVSVTHVPREQNAAADRLARRGAAGMSGAGL
jgi:ribonuclease HI